MNRENKALLRIDGRQIYLREICFSDANKNYCRWLNNSQVNKYLESRFERWSSEKLKDYIKEIKRDNNHLFLAIIEKEGEKHIGNIKLGPINRQHKFADIGVIIGDKDYWGKGFASEAIKLITDYAFCTLKLHKLTAGAYKNNVGSIKAFKKNGFSIEGVRKNHYFYKSKYVDAVLLGILRK